MKKKTRNNFEKKIERLLRRRKIRFKYESETVPYVLACHYIPDFIITTPTGVVYIETKGHLRREDKRKLVAVKKQHPEMDLRIVFYRLDKAKERWAIRHGFRFAQDTIPDEWLKGTT